MAGTAAGGNRRNPIAPYLLVAPGILWLIAFYVIPTLTLARTSVGPEGAAWYDGYQRAFTDYGVHLGRSFGYAFAATVVLVSALLSGLMARRKLDRLDLIAVLKTRD